MFEELHGRPLSGLHALNRQRQHIQVSADQLVFASQDLQGYHGSCSSCVDGAHVIGRDTPMVVNGCYPEM